LTNKNAMLHSATAQAAAILLFSLVISPGHAQNSSGASLSDVEGYLDAAGLPDMLSILPPAPQWGSPRQLSDEGLNARALDLTGTPRFELAAKDADLTFPNAPKNFACALGVPIDETTTPTLYTLMHKTLVDAKRSTSAAKKTYDRGRPFVANGKETCTPADNAALSKNGSYPSGHTTIGWTWGLILAQVNPANANTILQRAMSFGDSRVICNVHWQSDVDAGRITGSAVFIHLVANEDFNADLEKARQEFAAATATTDLACPNMTASLKSWLD